MDENEAFASMMDVLRALYHWKELVRSTAAVVSAVHASTVLQRTQIAARFLFTWRLAAFREKKSTRGAACANRSGGASCTELGGEGSIHAHANVLDSFES